MKINAFHVGVCLSLVLTSFLNGAKVPFNVRYARAFGADTKAIFNVVDYEGVPVEGATVLAGFYMNREPGKNPKATGVTDKNGVFVAEQKSVGEINYIIQRDKYYATSGRIDFRDRFNWAKCVEDGKWQPYGVTYNLTLKAKKVPIPMEVCRFEKEITTNTTVGFDLRIGDCVRPHGEGEVADFTFVVTEEKIDTWTLRATLTLSFTNALDGAYMKDKDMYSDYVSVYHADTNAVYKQQFLFEYNTLVPKKKIDTSLSERQYLILRTRTKVNDKNEIIEAFYSKLYGPLNFIHQGLTFKAYFNPTPNDTNLEFAKETIPRQIRP